MPETQPAFGPVAYLSGEYPRATDTFIQREVAQLRAQGLEVLTCSIRRTDPKHHVGPEQRSEFAATFQVQQTAKHPLRLLRAHWDVLRRSPRRWGAALALAVRISPPGPVAWLWQLFYVLQAAVLADHLHRKGVVHLHNHFANSSCSVAILASKMSGIPFSFTMHGPAIFFEPKHWRIDEKMAQAAFVACISHFCRAQGMMFADRAHWDKLKIVHCGVDPDRYGQTARTDFGQHMLFVGRLDAIKGVPLLLEALAALKDRHPQARLSIVGDGTHRNELQNQAQALGLADRVAFLGYQSQDAVADLLAEADMLVLPSFAEGVPVVLMEAMAAGIPVIASQVAGVGELVEDGVSGHLVPAGDLATLTATIDARLQAPAAASAAMGQAGRTRVRDEFDIAREAAWLKTLITDPDRRRRGLRPEP